MVPLPCMVGLSLAQSLRVLLSLRQLVMRFRESLIAHPSDSTCGSGVWCAEDTANNASIHSFLFLKPPSEATFGKLEITVQ